METLALLLHGFQVALTPVNLMWAFVGSVLGTAIGILPGIGPALTIALLLPVTVSVGIAVWPRDGKDFEQVLKAADRALYRAKEAGRNRVLAASGEPAVDRVDA